MSSNTNAAHAGAAAPACTTCAHAHAPLPDGWAALDFFDRRAMAGQLSHRLDCTALPDSDKPCLKPAAQAPAKAPGLAQASQGGSGAASPVVPVTGFLAESYGPPGCQTPAVILNPAAPVAAVVAWCWGEVASLYAASQALADVPEGLDARGVQEVFSHRLQPLESVLHALCERLSFEVRT